MLRSSFKPVAHAFCVHIIFFQCFSSPPLLRFVISMFKIVKGKTRPLSSLFNTSNIIFFGLILLSSSSLVIVMPFIFKDELVVTSFPPTIIPVVPFLLTD